MNHPHLPLPAHQPMPRDTYDRIWDRVLDGIAEDNPSHPPGRTGIGTDAGAGADPDDLDRPPRHNLLSLVTAAGVIVMLFVVTLLASWAGHASADRDGHASAAGGGLSATEQVQRCLAANPYIPVVVRSTPGTEVTATVQNNAIRAYLCAAGPDGLLAADGVVPQYLGRQNSTVVTTMTQRDFSATVVAVPPDTTTVTIQPVDRPVDPDHPPGRPQTCAVGNALALCTLTRTGPAALVLILRPDGTRTTLTIP